MSKALRTRSSSHSFRAPPPTPISTDKGLSSGAVDDRVLSEYLEASLRVPDLTFTGSYFPAGSVKLEGPAEVDFQCLVSGDELAVRRVLAAVRELGAVRVTGTGAAVALIEEARAAIEAGEAAFALPEGERKKWEIGVRPFDGRDGVGEELYWYRWRSPEREQLLQQTWPDSYPTLREKFETVAARLEMVADCIGKILSEQVMEQVRSKRIGESHSILCLRKYNSHHSRNNTSSLSDNKEIFSRALGVHVSGDDQEICICHSEGSAIFRMSAGDMLVTIGKQLEECSDGELKCASGKILVKPAGGSTPSFMIEYMSTPLVLSAHGTRTISLMDQLLILLILALLYNLRCRVFS